MTAEGHLPNHNAYAEQVERLHTALDVMFAGDQVEQTHNPQSGALIRERVGIALSYADEETGNPILVPTIATRRPNEDGQGYQIELYKADDSNPKYESPNGSQANWTSTDPGRVTSTYKGRNGLMADGGDLEPKELDRLTQGLAGAKAYNPNKQMVLDISDKEGRPFSKLVKTSTIHRMGRTLLLTEHRDKSRKLKRTIKHYRQQGIKV